MIDDAEFEEIHGRPPDQNWKGALVRFLDALTELAKLGTKALKEELANRAGK
jgi:hypothetical protein